MAVRIGVDHLVYSRMTTEDTVESPPVYEVPKRAPGVISINVNPNASQETLFADDGPYETATTLGAIDVEINKAELTAQNKADLLGHTIDSNQAVVFSGNDIAPFVALGFRSLKSNGNYRYVWLYKGRFIAPEDNNETKGDAINFQTDTISGQFVKLVYEYSVGEKVVQPWKYELDQDTPGANPSLIATWFTSVKFPNAS